MNFTLMIKKKKIASNLRHTLKLQTSRKITFIFLFFFKKRQNNLCLELLSIKDELFQFLIFTLDFWKCNPSLNIPLVLKSKDLQTFAFLDDFHKCNISFA